MPEIPIRLNLPDQQDVSPLDQSLQDVVVTSTGVISRPGYSVLYDLETSARIDGIYDWREQDLVVVVSNGKVFTVSDSVDSTASFLLLESGDYLLLEDGSRLILDAPTAVTEVTGDTDMVVGTRVIFGNYGDYLFMSNGAEIQCLAPAASQVSNGGNDYTCILNHTSGTDDDEPGVGANTATYWAASGASGLLTAWATDTRYSSGKADVLTEANLLEVSHVGVADTYLLALEVGTERIWFSNPVDPFTWSSEWVSAEHLPDDANAMIVRDGTVWVTGERSIQGLENDGVTPWVASGYGPISHGVLAPYSFLFVPELNTFVWIDDTRRVVILNGRTPTSLNHALDTWLQGVPNVIDAIGDYVVIEGNPFYILQFPTSQQSVCVNLLNSSFSEFSADSANIWNISAITNVPEWDLIVAGHRTDGTLLVVDSMYSQDNATDIPATIRSPRIQAKGVQTSPELVLHFKKIVTPTGAGDATITVRWRDDGGDWGTARTVTLTDNEKTDAVKHLYRLGHYRYYRQYEFDLSGLHPYSLVMVEQV